MTNVVFRFSLFAIALCSLSLLRPAAAADGPVDFSVQLDVVKQEGLQEHAREVGTALLASLKQLSERHSVVGDVRGSGLFLGLELVTDRATKEPLDGPSGNAIVKRCLEEGVVILKAGTYDNVIRLLPPLAIDEGLLEEGLETLDGAIRSLAPWSTKSGQHRPSG